MLAENPRASPTVVDPSPEPPTVALDAPAALVERYLHLVRARREVEEQLAFVRAELELAAATALSDEAPRGRFAGGGGAVVARLQPTCSFDRLAVARELQRQGRLADVAILHGPSLARFLAQEPVLAARLGPLVRPRRSVLLTASP